MTIIILTYRREWRTLPLMWVVIFQMMTYNKTFIFNITDSTNISCLLIMYDDFVILSLNVFYVQKGNSFAFISMFL